jgi:NAD+ kinase
VDGAKLTDVVCDGIVVATPVGATGYSLAAGGPPLAWGTRALVITAVAPRGLGHRPVLVSDQSCVTVSNASDRPLRFLVDGQLVGLLPTAADLHLRAGEPTAVLGQPAGSSFYRRLAAVFGPIAGSHRSRRRYDDADMTLTQGSTQAENPPSRKHRS